MIENLRAGDRVQVCWQGYGGKRLSVEETIAAVTQDTLTVRMQVDVIRSIEFDRSTGRQRIENGEYWLEMPF